MDNEDKIPSEVLDRAPNKLESSLTTEEVFGTDPITKFNRNFSKMISKTPTNPRKAMKHSMKSESAVILFYLSRDKDPKEVQGMFRAARSKIMQRMYYGLIYTCRRIARTLSKEGFHISPKLGGLLE